MRGCDRFVRRENRQPLNRQLRERGRFGAWADDRDRPAGGTHKQPCSGACARNGHAHAQPAIGSGPTERLAHRARIAKQPRQAAEIKDNLPGLRSIEGTRAAHLDSRRELARDLDSARRSHSRQQRKQRRTYAASFTATEHRDTEIPKTCGFRSRCLGTSAPRDHWTSPRPSLPPPPVASARRRARSHPCRPVDGCETRPPLSLVAEPRPPASA